MSEPVGFTYAVLRYFHDLAAGECINVGVAVYSPKLKFLGVKCTETPDRVTLLFPDLNRDAFTAAMIAIEAGFGVLSSRLPTLPHIESLTITELAKQVLPQDDSSLKWGSFGSGLTDNPKEELEKLFQRMVKRYETALPDPSRMASLFREAALNGFQTVYPGTTSLPPSAFPGSVAAAVETMTGYLPFSTNVTSDYPTTAYMGFLSDPTNALSGYSNTPGVHLPQLLGTQPQKSGHDLAVAKLIGIAIGATQAAKLPGTK